MLKLASKGVLNRNGTQGGITRSDSLLDTANKENTQEILRWFERVKVDGTTDKMPVSHTKGTDFEYILPYFDQTETFKAFLSTFGDSALSRSRFSRTTFIRIWKRHCNEVKPSKKKNKNFAQCDTCKITKRRLLATRNPTEKEEIRVIRAKHMLRGKLERKFYQARKHQGAYFNEDKVLSMIIDACDYTKFNLFRLKDRQAKLTEPTILRQLLQTVLVHGRGVYNYSTHPHVKAGGGPNFTLECLARTLDKLQLENPSKPLPKKLYLQLDNCTGSNKNKYMFAFADMLVRKGVFEEVVLSFLMVGHTHEDIDQLFSVISGKVKVVDMVTPDCMGKIVKNALIDAGYDNVDFEVLTFLHDYKGWLTPLIDPHFKNYRKPHAFSFSRVTTEADGRSTQPTTIPKVRMRYKHWHRCFTWYPVHKDTAHGNELPGYDCTKQERLDDEVDDEGNELTAKPWSECNYLAKLAQYNNVDIGTHHETNTTAELNLSTSVDLTAEAGNSYKDICDPQLPWGGSFYKHTANTKKEQRSFLSSPGFSVLDEEKLSNMSWDDIGSPGREPFHLTDSKCLYGKTVCGTSTFKSWKKRVIHILDQVFSKDDRLEEYKHAWNQLFEKYEQIVEKGTITADNDETWIFRWPLPHHGAAAASALVHRDEQKCSDDYVDNAVISGVADEGHGGEVVTHSGNQVDMARSARQVKENKLAADPVDVKKDLFLLCAVDITKPSEWETVTGLHPKEKTLPVLLCQAEADVPKDDPIIPVVYYRVLKGDINKKCDAAKNNAGRKVRGHVTRDTILLANFRLNKRAQTIPAMILKKLAAYTGPRSTRPDSNNPKLLLPFTWVNSQSGSRGWLRHDHDANGKPLPIKGFKRSEAVSANESTAATSSSDDVDTDSNSDNDWVPAHNSDTDSNSGKEWVPAHNVR
jgi:hypothetical protein